MTEALELRPGLAAGPVRWQMSVDELVAQLGPPDARSVSPGSPDRLTWDGAAPGGGELVVEVADGRPLSVGVAGSAVRLDGRTVDLRDAEVLAAQDPVLDDDAHVFLAWGVEVWGLEAGQDPWLRALGPELAAAARAGLAGAVRLSQVSATAAALPDAAHPWDVLPGEGLGPLRLGMTREDVAVVLGQPEKELVVLGHPREVRGDLVCVFDADGVLVELRWGRPGAVRLAGAPLTAPDASARLAGSEPLVNRSFDVHTELGLALQRPGHEPREVVVFAESRRGVWTNVHRPLL